MMRKTWTGSSISSRVMEEIDQLLERLSQAYAVSGAEFGIFDLINSELEGKVDRIEKDRFGNIIAFKKGKHTGSVILTAHLDEIGFMVRGIEGGYLRFIQH
ncbi:MAG TPA: hypothetical protein EYP24_04365, partial [bacterium (Candidatus Stahlbacteria)]|nr:hypothetical protein [Candidatus Stahlbacteria bacterium]